MPIGLKVLQQWITNGETHIDERTVPMNNAPRVLCTGINAGMADKSQERMVRMNSNGRGENAGDGSGRLPDPQNC